jgi:hypothetical protein
MIGTMSERLGIRVAFGGGGGSSGGGSSSNKQATKPNSKSPATVKSMTSTDKNVMVGGSAALCAVSTYVASTLPPVSPPTVVAKVTAAAVSLISCSVATEPIVSKMTN